MAVTGLLRWTCLPFLLALVTIWQGVDAWDPRGSQSDTATFTRKLKLIYTVIQAYCDPCLCICISFKHD